MIRTMPAQTANHNVPKNVLLMAETKQMGGEIVTTYYIDSDGFMWAVGDWVMDKPSSLYMFELCRLTGLTEGMIRGAYESWRRNVLGIVSN